MVLKSRGVKSRVITEITKDNLDYCKEILKMATEVRHLDEVKGNFSISDQTIYQAMAVGNFLIPNKVSPLKLSSELNRNCQEAHESTQCIFTTVRGFVYQQQYFFEMLWKKAIPAKQRIKEIEEGLKREFIETIQNPIEIKNLVHKVIDSATEQLDVIFSTSNSFIGYKREGIIDLLTQKADNGINVRILIKDNSIENDVVYLIKHLNVKVQYLNKSIKTKVTTLLADNNLSLVIEQKDEAGLATYSNSEPTVLSNASIFETLWLSQSNIPIPI
jgi:hypothetical protein